MQKKPRAIILLYILLVYVFLQFSWWAYQLISLHAELYAGNEYTRKIWMIIGEGSVFVSLLIVGFIFILNSLKKELELIRMQKNFMLSVTHEFKTPLASIKLYLQTLKRKDISEEQKDKIIHNSINDVDRLNNLTNNILTASLLENKSVSLVKEKINLSDLIEEECNIAQRTLNISINRNIKEGIIINCDENSLRVILHNLIENAVKYSQPNPEVSISVESQNDEIKFSISDNGIGINDLEKKKVLQKFYRAGSEETRKTKGTGLGLFIVNQLANLHGWTVVILDNNPKGTIIEIKIKNE